MATNLKKLIDMGKGDGKVLETLMKNSNSDAKTISGLNMSLQSMKASVNGVNATTKELKETLTGIDSKTGELKSVCIGLETKLQTEIISSVGSVKDEIHVIMDQKASKPVQQSSVESFKPGQLAKIQDTLEKLVTKVTLLEVKQSIETNSKSKNGKEDKKQQQVSVEKLSSELDVLGRELKSQLDDVHDMVAGIDEKVSEHPQQQPPPLEEVKSDLSRVRSDVDTVKSDLAGIVTSLANLVTDIRGRDKNTCLSVNAIAKLMKEILELTRGVSAKIPEMESKLVAACNAGGEGKAVIKDEVSPPPVMLERLELMNSKQDKLSKVVSRIKYLLEADDGEKETGGGAGKKKKAGKGDELEAGAGHQLLVKTMRDLKTELNDEMSNQGEMLTDLTNHIQV